MSNRIMKDESGILTFEWMLLITLLVIGIVGGIAVIRDALIVKAADTAGAIVALDSSYKIADPIKFQLTEKNEIEYVRSILSTKPITSLSTAHGSTYESKSPEVSVEQYIMEK